MFEGSPRVIAAVSGGPDSVCLATILPQIGAKLAGIAHFNHHLRGNESDQDERFVATLAARLEVPFYRSESRGIRGNLEQSARRARREFFFHLIHDGAGDRIALGHTLDDQAETVLFRILRGSGLAGLAGIHPITGDGFIRPLIAIRRAEVRDYLRSHGIEWREDSSNRDLHFARNRIRNELLPQLRRDWNPQIDTALAQLADLAFEEERIARQTPVCRQPQGVTTPDLNVPNLHSLSRALSRRLIRNSIERVKGNLRQIDFDHIERILEMGPGRLRIPGILVTRSFDWLHFSISSPLPPDPIEVSIPATYESASIRLEISETPASGCANLRVELAAPIVLRGWRPGDHYRPVGKSREQKIKEMFQRARVPSWRRPGWPILESGGKILWAKDFGPAEEFVVNHGGPVLQVWDLAEEPQGTHSRLK
jgi:tRNA(Ile)-lysidine synthase